MPFHWSYKKKYVKYINILTSPSHDDTKPHIALKHIAIQLMKKTKHKHLRRPPQLLPRQKLRWLWQVFMLCLFHQLKVTSAIFRKKRKRRSKICLEGERVHFKLEGLPSFYYVQKYQTKHFFVVFFDFFFRCSSPLKMIFFW